MDILFTGSLSLLSWGIYDKLGSEHKCILFDEKLSKKVKAKNISACFLNEEHDEEELNHVFGTFNFDTVIFFSQALDGTLKMFDELEKLENVLYICRQYPVKHFVYIVSNDVKADTEEKDSVNSRRIVMQACRNLCMTFANQTDIKFSVLEVPYLYSIHEADNQLHRWIHNAAEGKEVDILGMQQADTDFLCEEDLGELLSRMLDNPSDESYETMKLSGGNRVRFEEVGEAISACIKDTSVKYFNYVKCVPVCEQDDRARKEYGWIPMHNVIDDIAQIADKENKERKKSSKLHARRLRHQKFRENIRIVAEIVIAYAITLLIEYVTKNNVLINYIDFKFVYVVVIGMVNGLNAGIVAAILASVGYVFEKSGTMPWQVLFYNVQNWLPFACYFLLGTIAGYTKDRHEDEIIFAREENDILEQKYIFLNELYAKTLENKDAYNSQILGYKDSWGKLYSVIKELNSSVSEEVLLKSVDVLEEILDNSSVAIYSVTGKSDFARLNVCSKSVNNELGKSMQISNYEEMENVIRQGQLFVNTDCLPNYPAYAKAILKDGEMIAVVLLVHAADTQMNMEYANKFTIVTELIKDSLIRAVEVEDLSDSYIEGTQILKTEKFLEILHIKQQMREKEYLEFTIMRVENTDMSLEEIGKQVTLRLRNNDVVGLGENGKVYMILSQMNEKGISIITERMAKNHLEVKVLKGYE